MVNKVVNAYPLPKIRFLSIMMDASVSYKQETITGRAKNIPIYELTSPLEYKLQSSFNTRKLTTAQVEVDVKEWRKRLGYLTFETTKATIAARSQMVATLQAESRKYLRDYYKTRVWCLRPRRIDDFCYLDTFFSSTTSIRNFSCFQLFAFKASKFTKSMLASR